MENLSSSLIGQSWTPKSFANIVRLTVNLSFFKIKLVSKDQSVPNRRMTFRSEILSNMFKNEAGRWLVSSTRFLFPELKV